MQRQFVELGNGPFDRRIVPLLQPPEWDSGRKICRNQKVVNTNYSSFSILGLIVLLAVGGLINTVAYSLEWIVQTVQKRWNLDVYSRLEWVTNDTLQLQRLAHEELTIGTWFEADSAYPITMRGERLAVLDISDAARPKLSKPPRTYKDVLNGSETGGGEASGGGEKHGASPEGAELGARNM